MTIFTVHVPPQALGDARDQHIKTVLIPESPSLLALIFPLLWLIWYRLWWAVLFYVLISIVFAILFTTNIGIIASVLTFFPGLFLFLEGQQLRRNSLERRGWKLVETVEDDDLESAEYRYFYSVLEDRKNPKTGALTQTTAAKPSRVMDSEIEFPGSLGLG